MKVIAMGFEPNQALDERTRRLNEILANLERQYRLVAAPYIAELSRINSIRIPRYVVLAEEGDVLPTVDGLGTTL